MQVHLKLELNAMTSKSRTDPKSPFHITLTARNLALIWSYVPARLPSCAAFECDAKR